MDMRGSILILCLVLCIILSGTVRFIKRYNSGKKEIENIRSLVEKRRHIEAMVRPLQEEKAIADKVLEGAV